MKNNSFLTLIALLFASQIAHSQDKKKADSIIKSIRSLKVDTAICMAYVELANTYWNDDPHKMMKECNKAIEYAQSSDSKKHLSIAYHNKASAFGFINNIDSAMYYDKLCIDLYAYHKDDYQLYTSLNSYGLDFLAKGNIDSAMKYVDKAIELSKVGNHKKPQNIAYLSGGNCLIRVGRLEEAEKYYNEGIKVATKDNDIEGINKLFLNHSTLKIMQGNINDSVINNLKGAISYYRSTGERSSLSTAISTMASALTIQGNYEDAILNYKEGIRLSTLSSDTTTIATNYINISESFYLQDMADSASKYADSGIYYSSKIHFQTGECIGKAIKANHLIDKQKYGNILLLLGDSYSQAKAYQDNYSLCYILMVYGKYHLKQKHFKEAVAYLKEAIEIAQEMNNNFVLAQDYDYIQQCYSSMGNFKEAHKYLYLYSVVKDSLNNKNKTSIVNRLNTEYQTKQKDLKILSSEAQKKVLMLNNILLLGGILVSLFIGGYIFYRFRQSQKQKRTLQFLNSNINNLQSVMQHETLRQFGDIAKSAKHISSSKDPIRQSNKLVARIGAYNSLYESLFSSSKKNELSLSLAINQVFTDNCTGMNKIPDLKISGDLLLNFKKSEYLLLALNELIANSIEHAFSSIQKPTIVISILQVGDKNIIEYQDNGIGISDSKRTIVPGKGMRMLTSLIEQNLLGKLEGYNNSTGSYFKIVFKL